MSRRLLPVFDVAAGLAIGGLAFVIFVARPALRLLREATS